MYLRHLSFFTINIIILKLYDGYLCYNYWTAFPLHDIHQYSPGGCIAFEDRLFSIITMHKQKRNFFSHSIHRNGHNITHDYLKEINCEKSLVIMSIAAIKICYPTTTISAVSISVYI